MDRTLIDNLNYSTFLSIDDGKSSGSGFFISQGDIDYLVTAYHVLFNDANELLGNTLLFTTQGNDDDIENSTMIETQLSSVEVLVDIDNDLAVIPIGDINGKSLNDNFEFSKDPVTEILAFDKNNIQKLENVSLANEVFLIGFPTSLIYQDSKHFSPSKPILRKGIIAAINNTEKNIIIDCSAYYGNSGAPILEVCNDNSLKIIGVVSKYIPFVIEWRNNRESSITHPEFLNSGYSVCIPIDFVMNLIEG
ncbi:MAG: trypsin-like peptidase domain-containing protein [Balneola sp.]